VPRFESSHYAPKRKPEGLISVNQIEKRGGEMLLLDARAPARYRGEQEPIDPVAGRIPGAMNRFNMDNVSPQGTFKGAAQLKQEFQAVLGDRAPSEVVHYCGSGVAACHNLLAMEIAGLTGGRLYAGSWSEWIADPNRPIAR
jgi:thiosulfate/3-mercaptopyruvate sulfurtransferase